MKKLAPYQLKEDERGKLVGLINEGKWEEFNYLETKAGCTRGNHYHKETVELFFILEGVIDIEIISPKGTVFNDQVKQGDIIMVEPGENHVFHCLTDTRWINVLSKRFILSSPDIYTILNK